MLREASSNFHVRMFRAGQSAGLALVCALALALAAAPVQCSADSGTLIQPYTVVGDSGDIDLALAASAAGVPLRVDYRDREDAFDLDLLGAATGMCSLSGECNACIYRDTNPCQVADRYGAEPSLCQLPNFLGGAFPSDSLCGIGATVDVTLAGGSGSGSSPVATLTAFRTRGGKLMITLTARCGWVLLPSESTSTALNQSSTSTSGSDDYATSSMVILEGDIRYLGSTQSFARPAEAAMAGDVERYSCYSTGLRLRGISSRCQVLDLDLDLRFAVQRFEVIDGGGGDAGAVCVEAGPVLQAEAHLSMRSPKARKAVASTPSSATTAATPVTAAVEQAARQQLFSKGVAGTTSYTASVDPRDSEAAAWLQSLATQYPVVSVTPSSETLSFLIGALRKDMQQPGDLSAAGSSSEAPLLPAGLYLETCGRQSISAVVAAVVSALAAQGVTEKFVSDVVCLQSPYKEVAVSELPPCAPYTTVLFNVTLEIPLSSATGVTSSLLSSVTTSITASSSSSSSSSGSSGSATGTPASSPQALADALVGAQLAAPWACLSSERQMRMVTRLEVDLQLPNGPGVQTTVESQTASETTPSLLAPAPAASTGSAPAAGGDASMAINAPALAPRSSGGGAQTSFSTAATAAVAVVAALALVVALVAFFAVRSARKSKAAAAAAAEAAAAARAAAAGFAGGYAPGAPAAGKLSPLPAAFAQKAAAAAELPAALEAEPSYASTCDYAARGSQSGAPVGDVGGARSGGSTAGSGSGGKKAPTEGVVPWATKPGGDEVPSGPAPAASAASLEPFAAAVESAAAAAASVASASLATTAALPSRQPPTAGRTAAAAVEGSGPATVRILPVTPPPPAAAAAALAARSSDSSRSPTAAMRAPVSPPGRPALWRRGRVLRSSGASGGSTVSEPSMQGAGAGGGGGAGGMRAGGATVWSNALYDAPQQLYDSGTEGADAPAPVVSATSAR